MHVWVEGVLDRWSCGGHCDKAEGLLQLGENYHKWTQETTSSLRQYDVCTGSVAKMTYTVVTMMAHELQTAVVFVGCASPRLRPLSLAARGGPDEELRS